MSGEATAAYYFPFADARKLWDMRLLSVLAFVQPAPGKGAQALDALRRAAASFAFYGGEAAEFDGDDNGKLFNVEIGAVYYLTLPSQKGRRWKAAEVPDAAVSVSLEKEDAAITRWALLPVSPGRTELLFNLYDAKGGFKGRFSLRLKAADR